MQEGIHVGCIKRIRSMEKLKIEIPLILPEVPDEKDRCVRELMGRLQGREGIESVHVSTGQEDGVPQLCFHYNPDEISMARIEALARQTGASLTEKVGHGLIAIDGIRHARHARHLEQTLLQADGVLQASVAASGMVRLEYDRSRTNKEKILSVIREEGLRITDTSLSAADYASRTGERQDGAVAEEMERLEEKLEPDNEHGHEHTHGHGGILGKNTELIFSITCGALLGTGFGLSFVEGVPGGVSLALYIGAYFFGGFFTAKEAVEEILKKNFEIDFLMLVAAIGAAILGEWAEGALLLFLFSLGHALEHYAMNKARKSIAALAELAPKTALLKKNGKTEEVGIETLRLGDVIMVRPNSKISADGVVVKGQSSVNQAPITGESVPVDKEPVGDPEQTYNAESEIKDENRVFAGTINGNSTLEVKVIKEARDSTLSRLVKLVNEAQTQKSPTQRFTDKFEDRKSVV